MFRASWAERFYGIGMGNYDLKNPDAACAFPGTARGTPRRALRQGQCISGSVREIDTTNLDLTTLSELALIKPAAQPVRVVSIHHKETATPPGGGGRPPPPSLPSPPRTPPEIEQISRDPESRGLSLLTSHA
jgi:hypothetical protein